MKRQVFTVAGAVALLLVVVAAASRTQLFHESEPPVTPGLSRLLVDFTLYLFIAFEAGVGLLVIWALWPREEYGMPEIKRPPWWHLLIQYAALALVFGIGRLLAVHQFPRRRHETPEEYLARVLAELDIREAAIRRLTELYQFAKFSQHPVDEAMRADALDALADVRSDLLTPSPDAPVVGQPVAT